MSKERVRQFNGDRGGKKDVLDYCTEYFEKRIIEEAYKGNDVRVLALAITEIKKAFDQMDIEYAIPKQEIEPENPAR